MTASPKANEGGVSVRHTEIISWSMLAAMTIAGGMAFSGLVAWSLFVGGLIANISFWLLKRDVVKFLSGPLTGVKARFLIKYYLRLTVLGLLLFWLVKNVPLHLGGLLVGLSCVAVSVVIAVLVEAKKIFLGIKEA